MGVHDLRDVDFWTVVHKMLNMVAQPRIALDAVVAVALAELGFVSNCRPKGMSVLGTIAGETAEMTNQVVGLLNPGGVWISPFRALTADRVVMALDGRAIVRMVEEVSGVNGTTGIFKKCVYVGTTFICCEPLPYFHIKEIKSNMPKAFAALGSDSQVWTDELEKALRDQSSKKVPLDRVEVDAAVSLARDSYAQNIRLSGDCVRLIFFVKRMGDVLYQYSLRMVHPDVTRVEIKRLESCGRI